MAENEFLKPRIVNRWRSCNMSLLNAELTLAQIAEDVVIDLDRWVARRLAELAKSGTTLALLIQDGQQQLFPVGPVPIALCPNLDFADLVASAAKAEDSGTQQSALQAVADRLTEVTRDEVLMVAREKPRFQEPEARSALARVLWPEIAAYRKRLMQRLNCAVSGVPFRERVSVRTPAVMAPNAAQMVGLSLRRPNGEGAPPHARS